MSNWIGWIELLGETALLAVAFIATYDGTHRLAANGLSRGAALIVALGLLLPVYEGGVSLTVPSRVRQAAAEQAAMSAPEPAGGWEKMPGTPEQRTKLSANAAMINFLVTGRPGQFIDATGSRVTYAPSPQDLQMREGLVRDEKGAQDTAEQFLERGFRLLATAFVSLLVGLVVGLRQRGRGRP